MIDYKGQDVQGWWMSEKLDGVQGVWTGEQLETRTGHLIHAPESFLSDLPRGFPLVGELWGGRGKFQTTSGTVRSMTADDDRWGSITYNVFNTPLHDEEFEVRMAMAREKLTDSDIARVVPNVVCVDRAYMEASFRKIVAAGGEGLVFNRPLSYFYNRNAVIRLKPVLTDEAEVTGYQEGTGKYAGQVGALVCRWRRCNQIKLGTGMTDAVRRQPPAIGAVVTFSYNGLTNSGLPRHAAFVCQRDDI